MIRGSQQARAIRFCSHTGAWQPVAADGLLRSLPWNRALAAMETLLCIMFLLIAATLLPGCTGDVLEASYPTAAVAAAADAVKHGWIPAWIPAAATELREAHDLDTNQSVLSFTSPQPDWRPPRSCRPASGGAFPEPAIRRAWVPSPQELTAAYERYTCSSNPPGTMLETVAVQRGGNRVVHWRVLAR